MRTKKSGVFGLLAAVLLISTVLLTNCVDPMNTGDLPRPEEREPSSFTPPPGKGYFKLNVSFAGMGTRTITPDTSGITSLDDFNDFDIYIIDSDDIELPESRQDVLKADVSDPVLLERGTYTVRVFGKKSGNALAVGEGPVTIEAGTGGSVDIVLKGIVDGQGTGGFLWDLKPAVNTPATNGRMRIIPLNATTGTTAYQNAFPSTVVDFFTYNLLKINTPINLNSGYYRVEIEQSRTGHKTMTTVAALHIYEGFISTFEYNLPDLKPNVYTIPFFINNGSISGPYLIYDVTHGSRIYLPANSDLWNQTYPPVHWQDSSIPFGGLYYTYTYTYPYTGGGTPFYFYGPPYATYVPGPIIVYAKWLTTADFEATIDVTNVSGNGTIEPELIAEITSVLKTSSGIEITVTLTMTNVDAGPYAAVIWGGSSEYSGNHATRVFNSIENQTRLFGSYDMLAAGIYPAPFAITKYFTLNVWNKNISP